MQVQARARRWSVPGATSLSQAKLVQLRVNLTVEGLAPLELTRRRRPVVFVDLGGQGWTFEQLYGQVRRWIADEHAQWDAIRHKLRFVGVTWQKHTSANTWRWQRGADWPREVPASAIKNVSMDRRTWSYLGSDQPKATGSFRRERWIDEAVAQPGRDERRLRGLAEAVALVELGRGSDARETLAAQHRTRVSVSICPLLRRRLSSPIGCRRIITNLAFACSSALR
jgi:hypothetical protein